MADPDFFFESATLTPGVESGHALAVSVATRRSSAPESLRIFFGDGVFLVAAWVGMWYPLDTLVYTPRPLRREREVLQAMSHTKVVVEASDD